MSPPDPGCSSLFSSNGTPTPAPCTLSLHDALPISARRRVEVRRRVVRDAVLVPADLDERLEVALRGDRKSTRLNSSHPSISYAVFCLKKKTKANAPSAHATSASHPAALLLPVLITI